MIRTLALIAAAGFVVSAATLSAAFFITGPANVMNGAWSFGSDHGWSGAHWRFRDRDWTHGHWSADRHDDDAPTTSRDLAWTGGDTLVVDVAADVHYTQAPGPAKLTVSGPKDAVDNVQIEGGRIRYADDGDHDGRLAITLSAPSVTHFSMEGSGALDLAAYRQDALVLAVNGDAEVKGAGETKTAEVHIAGSGTVDLGAMKSQTSRVQIDGSGDATVAPIDEADINIAGSGEVTLNTHPSKLHTSVAGSGHINHSN